MTITQNKIIDLLKPKRKSCKKYDKNQFAQDNDLIVAIVLACIDYDIEDDVLHFIEKNKSCTIDDVFDFVLNFTPTTVVEEN